MNGMNWAKQQAEDTPRRATCHLSRLQPTTVVRGGCEPLMACTGMDWADDVMGDGTG